MFFRAPEAHARSLLKAVSWRVVGSIDTFVISFFVTGRLTVALSIASVETFTKIAIYYFHERAWAMVPWGRPVVAASQPAPPESSPAATTA
jgi:uncharacterized membrane protein